MIPNQETFKVKIMSMKSQKSKLESVNINNSKPFQNFSVIKLKKFLIKSRYKLSATGSGLVTLIVNSMIYRIKSQEAYGEMAIVQPIELYSSRRISLNGELPI